MNNQQIKAPVKVVLGWFVIATPFACIYGLGKLRQYLEFKFNGGYEYDALFPNGIFNTPIDESISGVMTSGIFSFVTVIFGVLMLFWAIALFLACSLIAYKIGNNLLNTLLKRDKQ